MQPLRIRGNQSQLAPSRAIFPSGARVTDTRAQGLCQARRRKLHKRVVGQQSMAHGERPPPCPTITNDTELAAAGTTNNLCKPRHQTITYHGS